MYLSLGLHFDNSEEVSLVTSLWTTDGSDTAICGPAIIQGQAAGFLVSLMHGSEAREEGRQGCGSRLKK